MADRIGITCKQRVRKLGGHREIDACVGGFYPKIGREWSVRLKETKPTGRGFLPFLLKVLLSRQMIAGLVRVLIILLFHGWHDE
jgi:hypothetical protein